MPPSDIAAQTVLRAKPAAVQAPLADNKKRGIPVAVFAATLVAAAAIAALVAVLLLGDDRNEPLSAGGAPVETDDSRVSETSAPVEPSDAPTSTEATVETAAPTTGATTSSVAAGSAEPPTTTKPPPTTRVTNPPDPEAAAANRLARLIAADASQMSALEEKWVPQLSAKTYGTVWRGVTYDFQDILAEHVELRDRYGAILVDGATYSFRVNGQPMYGWYITLVPRGSSGSNDALAWCDAEQIGRDDCFAKLITDRPDPGQTVVLNS
jgi:serine/threonine-protein kinase